MKVKLRMFRIAVLVYVILVCGFAVRARACDCYPPCGDCKRCEAGVCVEDNDQDQTGGYTCNEPDVCGYCQKCSGGACVDDDAGGNTDEVCVGCKTCQSGECESGCPTGECCDDDVDVCVSSCPGDKCEICSVGTCIDSCPIIGKHCDGAGNCEECITDAHCTLEDHYGCGCEDHECEDCWKFSTISSNEVQPCPECDDDEGGCYSTHTRIPEEYAVYVNILNPPASGQIGVCGLHYKTEVVRFLTTCVEYQTDAQKIFALVIYLIDLGMDVSSIASCSQCAGGNLTACSSCFSGLLVGEIWDEIFDRCSFTEGCNRCPWDDTSCSYPLNTPNVVDLGAVDLCFGTE